MPKKILSLAHIMPKNNYNQVNMAKSYPNLGQYGATLVLSSWDKSFWVLV